MSNKARLIEILNERSVRYGSFVLASGKESDFYLDGRQTTLDPEGAWIISEMILDRLNPEVQAIGGLTMGADPVACSVSAVSWKKGQPMPAFLIRKQPKGHGLKRCVEGRDRLEKGAKVCIVEDTTTTGGSLLEAIEKAENEGLVVVQTLTVVDREEGATARLAAAGFDLEALVGRSDLEA
jgi:orotate phosphoribosyltransferase